jgi:cell division protein FtsI (penicillin-binding protein 3)
VVERGTAVDADMATYALAGKTGTPRRTVDGRYAPQQYNPNFVGLFPADKPQLVIVVKVSSPKGDFYGGRTAAPMTKTILQAALAARDAALDRSGLTTPARVASSMVQAGRTRTPVATIRRAAAPGSLALSDSTRTLRLDLPAKPEHSPPAPKPRTVPNVGGMNLRDAVRSLHFAGFRVQLTRGESSTSVTQPAPGALASAGSLVRLRYNR